MLCVGHIIGIRTEFGKTKSFTGFEDAELDLIDCGSITTLIEQLEGRFVLLIVDSTSGGRVCTDKYGKRDVFIQKFKYGYALASNIALLPEDPSLSGYDQTALAHMLTYYGYCPAKKQTIYNNVSRLGVGEIATLVDRGLVIKKVAFKPKNTSVYGASDHSRYSEAFLDHLRIAGSDRGNVVYLSSGWDSSAILAGLVYIFGADKVRAVIGRMRYSERSGICNQPEIERASSIAEYYGVRLDIVEFDFVEDGPEYLESMKSTMQDSMLYSVTAFTHGKLAEKAVQSSNGEEVVFAGEISDGVHNLGFSQYATVFHKSYEFREYADKMASYLFGPTFFSAFLSGDAVDDDIYKFFISRLGDGVKFDPIAEDYDSRKMQILSSFFLRNGRIPLWSLKNSKLLTEEGRKTYTEYMQITYLAEAASSVTPANIYSWYIYLYNSFHWQGATVRSLQLQADVYGLISDLPFWDMTLQEFLSSMPEEWGRGLDLNNTKYPLKQMLRTEIDYPIHLQKGPHSYTYDIEPSFNHMEEIFCYSKLTPILQKVLSDKPYHQILSPTVFDLIYLDRLVEKYLASDKLDAKEIQDLVPVAMLCFVGWFGQG